MLSPAEIVKWILQYYWKGEIRMGKIPGGVVESFGHAAFFVGKLLGKVSCRTVAGGRGRNVGDLPPVGALHQSGGSGLLA